MNIYCFKLVTKIIKNRQPFVVFETALVKNLSLWIMYFNIATLYCANVFAPICHLQGVRTLHALLRFRNVVNVSRVLS